MTYDEAETKMKEAGAEHGRNAASWYFDGNTSRDTYARVLRGIEEGDPEVMDTLPSSPLSGEWADEPNPFTVLEATLGKDYSVTEADEDELLRAYEDAFTTAAQHEIERVCVLQLETVAG